MMDESFDRDYQRARAAMNRDLGDTVGRFVRWIKGAGRPKVPASAPSTKEQAPAGR